MSELSNDVVALRTLGFFSELTEDDLVRVAKIGRRRTSEAGGVLVERGADSGGLFVILSGQGVGRGGGRNP